MMSFSFQTILTAKSDGRHLVQLPVTPWKDTPGTIADLPHVLVNPGRKFQKLLGFGAAFTEAAAVTWKALPKAQADQVLADYFDESHGHGYHLCRVHMNSCDFSLGNYAHAEVPDDMLLKHFTIDRDRNALLPLIKAAQRVAKQPLQLLVSPWSPPAWIDRKSVV